MQHSVTLSNCQIYGNEVKSIISVKVFYYDQFDIPINIPCAFLSNVSITNYRFAENNGNLLNFYSNKLAPCAIFFIERIYIYLNNLYLNNYLVNYHEVMDITRSAIVIGQIHVYRNKGTTFLLARSSHILFNAPVNISDNEMFSDVMIFQSTNVLFNGLMTISKNSIESVMQMHSCNVIFNGLVKIYGNIRRSTFTKQLCNYVIQFEFCDILFSKTTDIKSNECEDYYLEIRQ